MPSIRTLLGLLAAGTVMVDSPLPKRLITKVVCVLATVVVSAVMIGALLLAAMIYGYQTMVMNHGLAPLEASLYILCVIAALAALAVFFATVSIRTLIKLVPTSIKKNVPITSHLGNEVTVVARAFFDGLMGKRGL